MVKNEGLRDRVEARIEELCRQRLALSDRIFDSGRTPYPWEWDRLAKFDEKIEGLYHILNTFFKTPEAGVTLDPFLEVLY